MSLKLIHKKIFLAQIIVFLSLSSVSDASQADSESNYRNKCTTCHGLGVAGAPKLGDIENWAPRIKKGVTVLYKNAINGFSGKSATMPPKGGFTNLTDEEIKNIVDYMVENSQ